MRRIKNPLPERSIEQSSPFILGINPWIHDFAAYDFWARPLGLLLLLGMLRSRGARVAYYDCLGAGQKPSARLGRAPYPKTPLPKPTGLFDITRTFSRYGLTPERVREELSRIGAPDLVLVTSLMTYWYPGVAETIALVREVFPKAPIILGGVYATIYPEHAARICGPDAVITGPGETSLAEAVARYTRWNPAPLSDPHDFPPALDLLGSLPFAPLLTSRGCPYACAYCASRYLEPAYYRRDPDTVAAEIRYWHEKYKTQDFVFYDDALLVNGPDHLFPVLKQILSWGLDLRFHTPNAVHIRHLTQEAADLLYKAGCRTLRLGLETTDFEGRGSLDQKLTRQEFLQAAAHLKKAGFGPKTAGAYILAGLPGQDYDLLGQSIRLAREAGILPILTHYSPLPHTRLWDAAKQSSRYDLESDPIFTNRAVCPCQKEPFSWERLSALKRLALG